MNCQLVVWQRKEEEGFIAGNDPLEHGLASESVEEAPVEQGVDQREGSLLGAGQGADEAEAIDGPVGINGNGVDEGDEGQAIAECEADDAGGGEQRLCGDLHIRHLHGTPS